MNELGALTAVVPFHNYENNMEYLKSLIESVGSRITVIVVCDSISTKNFDSLSRMYENQANILFIAVNNRSAAKSRNHGLEYVKSPWVIFLDCDDEVYIDKYLELVESEESSKVDLIIGQIQTFDNYSGRVNSVTNTNSLSDLATFPAFTRVIYRYRFIANQRFPKIPLCEDQCFLAALISRKPQVFFSDYILYRYRVNNPNQGTNILFNFSSHLEAIEYFNHLMLKLDDCSTMKIISIFKFRMLVSMLKRLKSATVNERKIILRTLLKMLVQSPSLLKFVKPRRNNIKDNNDLPCIILVGGLGNQIFQYVFMKSQFGDGGFRINVNLGNPRNSVGGIAEIFSFKIGEQHHISKNFVALKAAVCRSLLMISSHGQTDLISTFVFRLIRGLNLLYSIFNKGIGWIFLANGVGYFEDKEYFNSYKYYIGCFHSFRWKERLDKTSQPFALTLRTFPVWLKDLELKYKNECVGIVHIRRGDYLRISNLGYLPLSYFEIQMRSALADNLVHDFLIFSDDPLYVQANLSDDLKAKCHFVDFDLSDASANLIAMSQGQYFILSNSTFSWWAAALAQGSSKTVVAPKWWYTDRRSPVDIHPPEWIKVEVSN